MRHRISKPLKLTFCAAMVAGLLTPIPASAQFGGLFGGKSKNEETETVAAPGDKAEAVDSTEVVDSESTPDPATTSDPATTPVLGSSTEEPAEEGASSFSTLCGNGQGKPDGTEVRKKRRGIFGIADRMASVTRRIPLIGDFMVDSANSLSQSIACRLYPEEQKQAAEATQEATRGGEIGKKVEWQSTVRENVSGSSTVSSKNQLANGTPCMALADIIIVDGEELKVSKTMCRLPGASRYTIMTA